MNSLDKKKKFLFSMIIVFFLSSLIFSFSYMQTNSYGKDYQYSIEIIPHSNGSYIVQIPYPKTAPEKSLYSGIESKREISTDYGKMLEIESYEKIKISMSFSDTEYPLFNNNDPPDLSLNSFHNNILRINLTGIKNATLIFQHIEKYSNDGWSGSDHRYRINEYLTEGWNEFQIEEDHIEWDGMSVLIYPQLCCFPLSLISLLIVISLSLYIILKKTK